MRLAFHSRYPWEDWDYEGAEAMQYSLKYDGGKRALVPNIMMYSGVRLGVLYRKEYFDFVHNLGQGLFGFGGLSDSVRAGARGPDANPGAAV